MFFQIEKSYYEQKKTFYDIRLEHKESAVLKIGILSLSYDDIYTKHALPTVCFTILG